MGTLEDKNTSTETERGKDKETAREQNTQEISNSKLDLRLKTYTRTRGQSKQEPQTPKKLNWEPKESSSSHKKVCFTCQMSLTQMIPVTVACSN